MTSLDEYQQVGRGGGDLIPTIGDQDQGDGEGGRLIRFLIALEADILEMIEQLPEGMPARARAAYEEGVAEQFEEMRRRLREEWGRWLHDLDEHGLTGAQADFKLTAWEGARAEYKDVLRAQADGRDEGWLEPMAKDYLEVSDIILDSLSSALNAGAAVAEFKKMIEWMRGAGWRWLKRMLGGMK